QPRPRQADGHLQGDQRKGNRRESGNARDRAGQGQHEEEQTVTAVAKCADDVAEREPLALPAGGEELQDVGDPSRPDVRRCSHRTVHDKSWNFSSWRGGCALMRDRGYDPATQPDRTVGGPTRRIRGGCGAKVRFSLASSIAARKS